MRIYDQALGSIKNCNIHGFKNAVVSAKRCMRSTINSCVQSEFLKYVITKDKKDKKYVYILNPHVSMQLNYIFLR